MPAANIFFRSFMEEMREILLEIKKKKNKTTLSGLLLPKQKCRTKNIKFIFEIQNK